MDEEWTERYERTQKWLRAMEEGPSPKGMKRCMTCFEVMSYEKSCLCLEEVGKQIRAKAKKALAAAVMPKKKKRDQSAQQKKKYRDQGSLF